jgi:hypothetical protein
MYIIKNTNIKCPNKKCKTKIYREWNIGVSPRLVSIASLHFRCQKCEAVFYINLPMYMISKYLDYMPSDPDYKYIDGELTYNKVEISEDDEKLFQKIMKESPKVLIESLRSIEKIDLDKYKE